MLVPNRSSGYGLGLGLEAHQGGQAKEDKDSDTSEISFEDFAAIAAKAERSPVFGTIALPAVGDQECMANHPSSEDNAIEAAQVLMKVVADNTANAPRRAVRLSQPNVQAAPPSSKKSKKKPNANGKKVNQGTIGKKSTTVPIPSAKVKTVPAPKPKDLQHGSPKKPESLKLKESFSGGIAGITMAPREPYTALLFRVLQDKGFLRVSQIWTAFKQEWPYYATIKDRKELQSLGNSIRHTLSLKANRCVKHV